MTRSGQPRSPRWSRSDLVYTAFAAALVVLTVVRLMQTYGTFVQTYDEPAHIASGMEWLDRGTYNYELQHPPLARIAVALGPYFKGLRSYTTPEALEEGNAILHSDGDYWRNLRWARLGTLPFLVMACLYLFLWARRWFSTATATWAVVLFLSLPPVLAHSGLATLDIACTATVLAALYHWMRWLEEPSRPQSVRLGIFVALAILTKFSSIAFLGVCFGSVLLYDALTGWRVLWNQGPFRLRFARLCWAAAVSFIVLWAGYRFTFVRLADRADYRQQIDRRFPNSSLTRGAAYALAQVPLPLMQVAIGVAQAYDHNGSGHDSYLLGEYRNTGWWYFFPVVVGVKTPIGFLLLFGAGLYWISRRSRLPWQQWMPAIFAAAILLACMASRINVGVRYVLPIYPLMALLGGHAIYLAFQQRNRHSVRIFAAAAVCVVAAETWRSHPDYLAYFNQFAGSHPETVVAESDLDWGQDLQRLSERLRTLGVDQVAIRYFGTAELDKATLPRFGPLSPVRKTAGYVAISIRFLTLEFAKNGAYGWLKQYTPAETIGKSIYLYRVD